MLWSHLWPGFDSVWPNILADMIVGVIAWIWGRRVFRRARRDIHDRLDHLHAKHDELHEKMNERR